MGRIDPWSSLSVPKRIGELSALRADTNHPCNPRWTKDHPGKRGLQFEFSGPVAYPSVLPKLHGIVIWTQDEQHLLRLTLQHDQDWELFCALSEDIMKASSSAASDQDAVDAILGRLDRWQRFLAKDRRGLLSDLEIQGLVGELTFLHDELIPRFGPQSVSFWNGPSGSPQDFAVGAMPVEVKTRAASAPTRIMIASPEQLWPALPEMYLVVYSISKSLNLGLGRSLAELVDLVRKQVGTGVHLDELEERLESVGYLDLADYEAEAFLVGPLESFRVAEGFPRVLPSAIPDGVDGLKYQIHLDRCRPFATAIPWDSLLGGG